MTGAANPTLRQRQLATRLREIRLASGYKLEDVSSGVLISTPHLSKIETGARRATLRTVKILCDFYGVDPAVRSQLMSLAKDSGEPRWWQDYGLPEAVATYVALEDSAESISYYEGTVVPGLLQTEDYALATTAGTSPDYSREQVEQVVAARLARQRKLASDEPPEVWAVIDESALHRVIGSPAVMRHQLEVLSARADDRRITVQVVALEAGAHPGLGGSFTILRLPEASGVVAIEGLMGNLTLQNAADLTRFQRAFDRLRAIALGPRESLDRIQRIRSGFSA